MSPGKAAAQAGHAFVGCLHSHLSHPLVAEYLCPAIGTKVCLRASSLRDLLRAWSLARLAGIPVFLVTDEGCLNFFAGRPIVTALGVGPIRGSAPFLRNHPLLS
jgi:peptidyl-tRNA hydrolase